MTEGVCSRSRGQLVQLVPSRECAALKSGEPPTHGTGYAVPETLDGGPARDMCGRGPGGGLAALSSHPDLHPATEASSSTPLSLRFLLCGRGWVCEPWKFHVPPQFHPGALTEPSRADPLPTRPALSGQGWAGTCGCCCCLGIGHGDGVLFWHFLAAVPHPSDLASLGLSLPICEMPS